LLFLLELGLWCTLLLVVEQLVSPVVQARAFYNSYAPLFSQELHSVAGSLSQKPSRSSH
jgi:hypothetical protein